MGSFRERGVGEGVPGFGARQGLHEKCWRRGCDEQECEVGHFAVVWRAGLPQLQIFPVKHSLRLWSHISTPCIGNGIREQDWDSLAGLGEPRPPEQDIPRGEVSCCEPRAVSACGLFCEGGPEIVPFWLRSPVSTTDPQEFQQQLWVSKMSKVMEARDEFYMGFRSFFSW